MFNVTVNGITQQIDGNVSIEINEVYPEKYRSCKPYVFRNNKSNMYFTFYRLKDLSKYVGYTDEKVSYDKISNLKGVKGIFSDVTPEDNETIKVPYSELNFLDDGEYPIVYYRR